MTRVRKGDYFEELITTNPFKELPMQYTYDETPRNVGIHFKDWHIMVQLFDDDPSQVDSFNEASKRLGLSALGVTRVRREGVKRAEKDTNIDRLVGEIKPTDSYVDTDLFMAIEGELRARIIEDYFVEQIGLHGAPTMYEMVPIIESLAQQRGITPAEQVAKFTKRGVHFTSVLGDVIERPEVYHVVRDGRKTSA